MLGIAAEQFGYGGRRAMECAELGAAGLVPSKVLVTRRRLGRRDVEECSVVARHERRNGKLGLTRHRKIYIGY